MLKLSPRRSLLLLLCAALLSGCGRAERHGGPADVREQLARGRMAAEGWITEARTSPAVAEETALALGYLERLRLGLGGPFRLIDFALHDPRLGADTRERLAWALLQRTAAGEAYEVDPLVLDRAGAEHLEAWSFRGAEHLRLIRDAIRESADPRAGELAVRLGYSLAGAEGTLGAQAPRIAARVAALVRDRELARADARELLDSARLTDTDALLLLRRWRSERRLQSEAPFVAPLAGTAERQALEMAPRLAAALRELAVRSAGERSRPRPRPRPRRANVHPSLLTPAAAARLLVAADSLGMPPLAPLTVALRGYRDDLIEGATGAAGRAQREALAAARTEEELVARTALLDERGPYDAAPSLALLWAAAGMRTLAQEEVWFPGFGGPTARELEQRFGLAGIRFSDDVPAVWRPYYRRLLLLAIEDLQRVLPALDLKGLRVRFDGRPRQEGTLAMHDPQRRELILPPASAAGTLAHEIAHDLDWQVALRRYRVRGDYATDRATRTARSRARDPLALRLQELYAGVTLPPGTSERLAAHARRPAEVFARNIDWFVAVSLAGTGRMNGYLTSVQDELLTGYGTVRPPELSGTAGDALIRILDVVAPVYPDTRAWFLRNYGSGRDLRAYDLARRVLETETGAASAAAPGGQGTSDVPPTPGPSSPDSDANGDDPFAPDRPEAAGEFGAIMRARDASLQAVDTWTCRTQYAAWDAQLEVARRRLVIEAAAARARGEARERALALDDELAVLRLARELYGAPFGSQVSEEAEQFVQQLAEGVRRVSQPPAPASTDGFRLIGVAGGGERGCGIR